jgi:hypothetical protein
MRIGPREASKGITGFPQSTSHFRCVQNCQIVPGNCRGSSFTFPIYGSFLPLTSVYLLLARLPTSHYHFSSRPSYLFNSDALRVSQLARSSTEVLFLVISTLMAPKHHLEAPMSSSHTVKRAHTSISPNVKRTYRLDSTDSALCITGHHPQQCVTSLLASSNYPVTDYKLVNCYPSLSFNTPLSSG